MSGDANKIATEPAARIQEGITALIARGHRVILWSDPAGEFKELASDIVVDGLTFLRRSEHPAIALKRRVEIQEPTGLFVIYEDSLAPEPERDWLLDIRLYAAPFAADATSMLVQDLGLRHQHLREHLKGRSRFLASRERLEKLQRWVHPDDLEPDLDLKMLAVAVRAEQADVFNIFSALFASVADLDSGESADQATAWQALSKLELEAPFWALVAKTFGYAPAEPKLWNLLLQLFATDMGMCLQAALPAHLKPLQLPAKLGSAVSVFLSQWRDSTLRQAAYDRISAQIAKDVRATDGLSDVALPRLAGCPTFLAIELHIAARLRDAVLDGNSAVVADETRSVITARLDSYWASARWPDTADAPRRIWNAYYRALSAAQAFLSACKALPGQMHFASPGDCASAYTRDLYRIDQLYRQYHEAADVVDQRLPDTLQTISQRIEDCYLNQFLQPLAQRWDEFVQAGLLKTWKLEGLGSQQAFFHSHVADYLQGGEDRRVFVVISDALRYEVAQELAEQLNGKNRFAAELGAQLGVLPSYTRLGMASLLPHHTLTYTDKGAVLADGQSTDGLEQRSKILAAHKGVAFRAEDFLQFNKTAGREAVKDAAVVYIYHNVIDAIGDSASTESGTFDACRKAIDEIDQIVSRIINNLNGHHVVVTADHGFLFRDSDPDELDRNALGAKPGGTVVAKKRYLIGKSLGSVTQAHAGHISDTAGTTDDMMFWVPKGVNRFHFVGGARFVHGGASLQEVIVPVVTIRHQRGAKAKATEIKKTSITVLGGNFRITTNRYVFTFLQTEGVSDRIKPVSAKVCLMSSTGQVISNVERVTMDSPSEDLGQRQRKVSLSLAGGPFSKAETFSLVITDADTTVEIFRIEVRIELAFNNDFDF